MTIAATVISTEITHTKRLEKTVCTLEEHYKILVEAMQDSIYAVDPKCRYRFMNSHHQKRLGINGDYIGTHYGDYHDQKATERFTSYIRQVIETKKPVCERYNEDARFFVRTYSPVLDPETGNVQEIVIISIEPHDRIE
jgi:PAS domain-containing protein